MSQATTFKQLHAGPQILVLPNAWDAASAALMEDAGAQAVATSSAAVAWAHGYADGDLLPVPTLLAAIGEIARAHDLWIISDEVYEDLVFPGVSFTSPLDLPELAERSVACASISKSHAAPGFRSGWCVGSAGFIAHLLPLSETMLFGNQPFIADMTALAVSAPSEVAQGMAERFARRAALIYEKLNGVNGLRVHRPDAGMFTVVDVNATGLSGEAFALGLLADEAVAVMPGESFGTALAGWIRISLTQEDALVADACDRIARYAALKQGMAA